MGKIRIKALGDETKETEQKRRDEARREGKKSQKAGEKTKESPKTKSQTKQESLKTTVSDKQPEKSRNELKKTASDVSGVTKKQKTKSKKTTKIRSRRYLEIKEQIDRSKLYPAEEALSLVLKTANTSFTGTVGASINLKRKAKELGLKSNKEQRLVFEKKFPLAHVVLGKTSDTVPDLSKKLDSIVKMIDPLNIEKLTLSSTMGPGVKVKLQ
jgi:hypothetical protein